MQTESSRLRAAFVERAVTPEPGCPLTGFIARAAASNDVHDDLFARLLLIESQGVRAALITVDMLGTDITTADSLRRDVADVLGTGPDRVMLNATHTHAGPASIELIGIADVNTGFVEHLRLALRELAEDAVAALEPCALWHRRGRAPGVGVIRRWPGQQPAPYPLDDTLDVLTVERAGGSAIGMVVSLPCHAVAAGTTLAISADFPGAMVRALSADYPGQVIAFAQGCAGDINPAAGVRDHESADETGLRLADAVRATLRDVAPTSFDGPIRPATDRVVLPLDEPPPREELLELDEVSRRPGADAVDAAMGEFARRTLAAIDAGAVPEGIEVPVQVLAIGRDPCLRVVGLPGECLSTLGTAVRRGCPHPTVVLGYTNGLMGYLADRRSCQDGGYEIDTAFRYYGYPARFASGAGERLVEAACKLAGAVG
ncbi:MAG: hypothetical protein JXQ73_06825 [Phycisphaerae bacterium]|nr:hypothetical protein [Phycisphaerae bacterium]